VSRAAGSYFAASVAFRLAGPSSQIGLMVSFNAIADHLGL
jgi:hypothetical protein